MDNAYISWPELWQGPPMMSISDIHAPHSYGQMEAQPYSLTALSHCHI